MMEKFYFRYGTVYYPLAIIAVIIAGVIGSSTLAIVTLLAMVPHMVVGLYLACREYISFVREVRSMLDEFLPAPPNGAETR